MVADRDLQHALGKCEAPLSLRPWFSAGKQWNALFRLGIQVSRGFVQE